MNVLRNFERFSPITATGKVRAGGVSEWPKEHASKACVGETPPWVQIPPPPPVGSVYANLE